MRARLVVAAAACVLAAIAIGAVLWTGRAGESPPDVAAPRAPSELAVKQLKKLSGKEIDRRAREFMDVVYRDLVAYWTPAAQAHGYATPQIKRRWPRRGQRIVTACGVVADQDAAFYCPADDTMYVGQRLATRIWRNQLFAADPGAEPPLAKKRGDMGLAFVLAHEYAHGIGELIGTRVYNPRDPTKAFELTADCAAGVWGSWVNSVRQIPSRSLRVAWTTAQQVGDKLFDDPDHHGTPTQRRKAWDTGFRAKSIERCNRYLSNVVPQPPRSLSR